MKYIINKFIYIILSLIILSGCSLSSQKQRLNDFIFSSPDNVGSLNSLTATQRIDYTYISSMIEGLYSLNIYSSIDLGIVSKMKTSQDGKTLTFTIKENAKWSNGDDVTADDFVFAWQLHFKTKSPNRYLFTNQGAHIVGADELINIKNPQQSDLDKLGIKQISKKTLQVQITDKLYINDYLIFPAFYPISRKFYNSVGEKYGTSPKYLLSNGPFILKQWSTNKSLQYIKNNNYYDEDKVNLDSVTVNLNTSDNTFNRDFNNNKTDFIYNNGSLNNTYKDKGTYSTTDDKVMWSLLPNFSSQYMHIKELRKAISLAINRGELASDYLADGSEETSSIVPSGIFYTTSGLAYRNANDFLMSTDPYKTTSNPVKYILPTLNQFKTIINNKNNYYGYDDIKIIYNDYFTNPLNNDSSKKVVSDSTIEELYKDFLKKNNKYAHKILKKELNSKKITLKILYEDNNYRSKIIADYLKETLSDSKYLKIKLISTKNIQEYTKKSNDYDLVVSSYTSQLFDAYPYIANLSSTSSKNFGHYNSKAFDETLNSINYSDHHDARFTSLLNLEQVALSDFAVIPLVQQAHINIKATNVLNLVTHAKDIPYSFKYIVIK